jgi:hypothetical protein
VITGLGFTVIVNEFGVPTQFVPKASVYVGVILTVETMGVAPTIVLVFVAVNAGIVNAFPVAKPMLVGLADH